MDDDFESPAYLRLVHHKERVGRSLHALLPLVGSQLASNTVELVIALVLLPDACKGASETFLEFLFVPIHAELLHLCKVILDELFILLASLDGVNDDGNDGVDVEQTEDGESDDSADAVGCSPFVPILGHVVEGFPGSRGLPALGSGCGQHN